VGGRNKGAGGPHRDTHTSAYTLHNMRRIKIKNDDEHVSLKRKDSIYVHFKKYVKNRHSFARIEDKNKPIRGQHTHETMRDYYR